MLVLPTPGGPCRIRIAHPVVAAMARRNSLPAAEDCGLAHELRRFVRAVASDRQGRDRRSGGCASNRGQIRSQRFVRLDRRQGQVPMAWTIC